MNDGQPVCLPSGVDVVPASSWFEDVVVLFRVGSVVRSKIGVLSTSVSVVVATVGTGVEVAVSEYELMSEYDANHILNAHEKTNQSTLRE